MEGGLPPSELLCCQTREATKRQGVAVSSLGGIIQSAQVCFAMGDYEGYKLEKAGNMLLVNEVG